MTAWLSQQQDWSPDELTDCGSCTAPPGSKPDAVPELRGESELAFLRLTEKLSTTDTHCQRKISFLQWSVAGNINYALGQAPRGDGEGEIGCDPGEFQGMDHASSWGHCCSSRGARLVWGCAGALCTQLAVPYLRLECPAENSQQLLRHSGVWATAEWSWAALQAPEQKEKRCKENKVPPSWVGGW